MSREMGSGAFRDVLSEMAISTSQPGNFSIVNCVAIILRTARESPREFLHINHPSFPGVRQGVDHVIKIV